MSFFRHLKSVARLNELSEKPIDLSAEGVLTPKRIETMRAASNRLTLFFWNREGLR